MLAILWAIYHRHFAFCDAIGRRCLLYTMTVVVPYVVQPYVLEQGFGHSFFSAMVALIPLMTIVFVGCDSRHSTEWSRNRRRGRRIVCIVLLLMDGFDRGMSLRLVGLALVIPLCSAIGNPLVKRTAGSRAGPARHGGIAGLRRNAACANGVFSGHAQSHWSRRPVRAARFDRSSSARCYS